MFEKLSAALEALAALIEPAYDAIDNELGADISEERINVLESLREAVDGLVDDGIKPLRAALEDIRL